MRPSLTRRIRLGVVGFATLAVVAGGATAPVAAGGASIQITQILSGYHDPVLVTNTGAANRRIFIVEQSGRIKIADYQNGAWKKVGVFLDIHGKVDFDYAERGLLGLAFAPDYATSGRFYVAYTAKANGPGYGPDVVYEYRRKSLNRAGAASARLVLSVPDPDENHNGGDIAFGPDGYLYVGEGDGGGLGGNKSHTRQKDSLLGKMLRIDPRDPDGKGPKRHGVPVDNPFVHTADAKPEIWAMGLRNPWRWAFDRATGDLWMGDVGQNKYEEIDASPATGGVDAGKGLDYGWNEVEGLHDYPSGTLCSTNCHTLPVYEYPHSGNDNAVIGGYVFRGPDYPLWYGTYVFSDNGSGVVRAMDIDNHNIITTTASHLSVSGFGEDAAGRLYMTALDGTIESITFSGSP